MAAYAASLQPFLTNLPHRPYCSNNLGSGLLVRGQSVALQHKYIQQDPPALVGHIVADVDRPEAGAAWLDANLPMPTWVCKNTNNGHAHLVYSLYLPVARTNAARQQPLRYLAAIQWALWQALGADHGYAGLVTKNPLHPDWHTIANGPVYTLGQLAEYLDLPARIPKREVMSVGLGRNVLLFDTLRAWSYVAVRQYWAPAGWAAWNDAVLHQALQLNAFQPPLSYCEVRATAKSVAKWVWARFSPQALKELVERTHTSELQAARGRQKGLKRKAALLPEVQAFRGAGCSVREIAQKTGLPKSTVGRWLK